MHESDGYLPGRQDDVGLLLVLVQVAVVFVIIYTTFFATPTPPPPASALKGCFTASNAPSLRFDGHQVHVLQRLFSPMIYRLALAKYGTIDVVTDEPVSLLPFGRRYVFDRGDQRTIVFGSLGHIVANKTYGVVHVEDAEFLDVLTPETSDVRYTRAPAVACASSISPT